MKLPRALSHSKAKPPRNPPPTAEDFDAERRADALRAMAAMARINRAERRKRFREAVAEGLALVRAARRSGEPVRRAVIEGVTLEFGRPEPRAPAADDNEWDQDLGTPSAVTLRP
jgi:hypothetical protein